MWHNQLGFWNRFKSGKKSSSRSIRQCKAPKRNLAVESLENRRLLAGGRALGSIVGTIFNDQNASTVRESSEPALRGWIVYADTNNNARLDRGEPSAISGRNGAYRLPLKPGTYTIREVVPANWIVSTSDQVTYPAEVTVEAGTTVTQDFGNQKAVGTVSGTVFNDADGNTNPDTGESGLSGWRIFADKNDNGLFDRGEPTTITAADGSYRLTLAAGTYSIVEVIQTNWQVTTPDGDSVSVTVTVGQSLTGIDFGNQLTETSPPTTGSFQIQLSMTGLTSSVQTVVQQAADRWEQVIVGDLPDVQYRGQTIDDVLIRVVSQRIDGVGNTLAEAGPEAFRANGGLPFLGSVIIDTSDVAQMQSGNELLDVMVHEIGHVLGFGTLWSSKGMLTGTRTSNPQFTGKLAVAEYNTVFSTSVTGVPVENTGGFGTALAHWRESIFINEVMVGTIQDGTMPLSRITVASMADIGYEVDMNAADTYEPTIVSSLVSRASSSVVATTTSNSQSTTTTAARNITSIATLFNKQQADRHLPSGITPKSATSAASLISLSSKGTQWSTAVDELLTKNWWG
jgi:hypothetical protein